MITNMRMEVGVSNAAARCVLLVLMLLGCIEARREYVNYPCTDIGAIDLLEKAIPSNRHVPVGVDIVYDDDTRSHAYKLRSTASKLKFPVEKALPGCEYFPEEYSILVTMKVNDRYRKTEYIFSVLRENLRAVRLGLRIAPGIVLYEYSDHKKKHKRLTTFSELSIFDSQWHTLIVTVTGDEISYAVDCGTQRSKTVKRAFPALVDIEHSDFYIGNKNRSHDRFTGCSRIWLRVPERALQQWCGSEPLLGEVAGVARPYPSCWRPRDPCQDTPSFDVARPDGKRYTGAQSNQGDVPVFAAASLRLHEDG
ncbi:PREDICTED: thrombospondin-type laminin G domain and EAR repeat-containing protein-like [Priapulus caudatus]|uniref:Thrombospondin-type laminin G domain and EAR repeat-containing protein-like n=1 Tax=Priapulus caudatus TaxID=37621 RepID=A0ABM1DV27_PRICU|nr:PREDICTED: thrombospondin-type laminin G domain and EAR repeat-containing protein-like [Priapulus caudatus]